MPDAAPGLGARFAAEALALEALWSGPGLWTLLLGFVGIGVAQAILRLLLRRWAGRPSRRDLGQVLALAVRLVAWAAAVALVLGRIAAVAPMIAAVGVLLVIFGLAFGIGVQARGWVIGWGLLLAGKVRIGDQLALERGARGVVERLGLLRLLLRTDEGARVVLPTRALTERGVTLSTPDQTVPVDLRLPVTRALDGATLRRLRILAGICPYRSWTTEPSVLMEGERTVRVRLQVWSTEAAEAAEAYFRDAIGRG